MKRKYVTQYSVKGASYTYFRYRDQKKVGLPSPDDPQFDAAYERR